MSPTRFRFNEFELDIGSYELCRSGHHAKLERLPMQLLILLVENPGRLVRRKEIVERLWGSNVFLEEEHSINTAVNKIRTTLRDDPRNPRFIRTVVGQGYCFIPKVDVIEPKTAMESESSVVLEQDASVAISSNYTQDSRPSEKEPWLVVENVQNEVAASAPRTAGLNGWKITALIALFAAGLSAWLAFRFFGQEQRSAQGKEVADDIRSVAVLPFRNLAETSEQDYLVDGLTDELTTSLARSTSLRVISHRSAMQYEDTRKPIQEIAKALNVDAIIEGSYLHTENQVRITAQLIDAHDDRHLWTQSYDESDRDLLNMQSQVTNDISQQVALALGSGFKRAKPRTQDPEAHEAFLHGQYFWNQRTSSAVTHAVECYREAIRRDPAYAEAYAALAQAYVVQANYVDRDPSDDLLIAQYAAERALELDNTLGEAHTALGAIRVERDWDWSGADREYRIALQLDPTDATAHDWYSLHLSRMGKIEEAEVEIQRAVALDPLSLTIRSDAATTAYWARNPTLAMKRIGEVLELSPDFAEAHLARGKILEQVHRYPEAISEYEAAQRLFRRSTTSIDALRAHALASQGRKEEALAIVRHLRSLPLQTRASDVDIAAVYCGLGEKQEATRLLDEAYVRREKGMDLLGIDPIFEDCDSDPKFLALLDQLRLIPPKLGGVSPP